MNSRRPRIHTTSRQRPSVTQPRAKPRAKPKVIKASAPLGLCLLCNEPVLGPAAIRLQHGAIQRRRLAVQFLPLPFGDGDMIKWICHPCASSTFAMADEGFRFSSRLERLSLEGWCCLCRQEIEPYPLKQWSSAILIERGLTERVDGIEEFQPRESGHLHFFCLDEVDIPIWRLIDRSDEPDLAGCLP